MDTEAEDAESRYARHLREMDELARIRRATGKANMWLAIIKRRTDSAFRRLEYPDEGAVRGDLLMARTYLQDALEGIGALLDDELLVTRALL